ncbi:hypothetical protein DWB77_07308 [Streptomyces hundungensis]|uniref:Streptomyces killer toxin-like beta/gamma crystallin domain-containing protein n=1 Tax=Streptomyces hundungensis TaxID=1077946 RepID=A0A387HSI3_9ACTN|nr:hypothetical protein [Streptomyces hundungensis]AYG85092.1 hypothetical protein DWB77_07308 [Streptomyces hundungensis]
MTLVSTASRRVAAPLLCAVTLLVGGLAPTAPAAQASPQTDAWPCSGPAQFFAARNGSGQWTCWANAGESYAKAYGVVHWQSGHNSGLFDYECHGATGSHRFGTDDGGDLPDCTIYHVEID